MLAAGSCQKENSLKDGDVAEVTFNIGIPTELSTKAIGDGTTATKLYYSVFNQDKTAPIKSLAQKEVVTLVGKETKLPMKLVRNYTYTLVFWAQHEAEGVDSPYTFDPATGVVKVSYKGNANDETRDAFCEVCTITVPDEATFSKTVTLRRPFAQINFGTDDFADITELNLDMESTVAISGLADTYDILKGKVSGSASTEFKPTVVPAQFNPAETLEVGTTEYGYVSMNYILAPVNEYDTDGNVIVKQTDLSKVTATFTYNNEDVVIEVDNVPYQRNFRTNIIGSLFTSDVEVKIVVDPEFHKPDSEVKL